MNIFSFAQGRVRIEIVLLIICISGMMCSIYAFYPGWMSPDSIFQYDNAVTGRYNSWHPVIMAWWWRVLGYISDGPGPFLVQNLMLFWVGFYFIAKTLAKYFRWGSIVVLLLAAMPSVLIIMAQLWKDAVFTSLAVLSIGIVFYSIDSGKFYKSIFLLLIFLLSFAVGCKPNGILVAIVLIGWWFLENTEVRSQRSKLIFSLLSVLLILVIPFIISKCLPVYRISPVQYIQSYDLLGIGVIENKVLLPDYITKQVGLSKDNALEFYFPGGNDTMFYRSLAGNIATTDPNNLKDLQVRWISAIKDYPGDYIKVRFDNFIELLRWGAVYPAFVAADVIVKNPWGYVFISNKLSDIYINSISEYPYLFFPWIYLSISLFSLFITKFLPKKLRRFNVVLTLLIFSFSLPHFFIAPAADYRYLHFSVVCAVVQFGMLLGLFFVKLHKRVCSLIE
ncbi:hypothetical protein OGV31_14785 [Citrobacter sp. Cb019]|uniref:hypothetical protein n=1 Tax=unclassified Citrobacter TaxID=2644389 RepID=UPI002017E100|nr:MULTISPECIES: hypothetical protein [unclassified Citrobacter]MDM3403665.1 hypothetical protein [Citrobacter sp. Cb019]MDM3427151.1 hypothetical protein [Citrobacter sp. Cb026]